MGKLIFLEDFDIYNRGKGHYDPRWYFADATLSSSKWSFDIRKSFPHRRAVHQKHFGISEGGSTYGADTDAIGEMRVNIRRFIERQCSGTVVWSHVDMNYDYLYEMSAQHRPRYGDPWVRRTVHHGYYLVDFEDLGDAMLFGMAYAHIVSEIAERHPDYEVGEEGIALAKANPWKGER